MSMPNECPYCGPVCAVGYGYCHCGCGEVTQLANKGEGRYFADHRHNKYVHKHQAQHRKVTHIPGDCLYCTDDCVVGFGLCHCGCGKPTTIATQTKLGECVIAFPRQYLRGHNLQNRKLDDGDVARLRRLYLDGSSESQLAKEFGVSQAHVSRLVRMHQRKKAGIAPA